MLDVTLKYFILSCHSFLNIKDHHILVVNHNIYLTLSPTGKTDTTYFSYEWRNRCRSCNNTMSWTQRDDDGLTLRASRFSCSNIASFGDHVISTAPGVRLPTGMVGHCLRATSLSSHAYLPWSLIPGSKPYVWMLGTNGSRVSLRRTFTATSFLYQPGANNVTAFTVVFAHHQALI